VIPRVLGHCCIEPERAEDAQRSGGNLRQEGSKKIAKRSIMPSIGPFERLSGDSWLRVIAQCNATAPLTPLAEMVDRERPAALDRDLAGTAPLTRSGLAGSWAS